MASVKYSDKPTYCRHCRIMRFHLVQLFFDFSSNSIVARLAGMLFAMAMERTVSFKISFIATELLAAAGIYASDKVSKTQ